MKIAMVSVHTSPAVTGMPPHECLRLHIAELASELGRMGHDVTIYTQGAGRRSPERVRLAPRVTVQAISGEPLSERDLLSHIGEFAGRLAERWAADRPDVIHAHHWLSGVAAIGGADGLGIPVVQTFHGLALESQARARMEKAIGRGVDALISTTESECTDLVRLGVPRRRISTVPSGVDTERFEPNGPALLPRDDTPRILMLAREVEGRSVATAIQALTRVPEAELVVAGGPPKGRIDRDPAVRRLRTLARKAKVAGRVRFIGQVDHAQVPELLRSADMTLSLPKKERFGRVTVESMACGTPVVVSAVGGHLDTVIHDVTGVYAQPDRPVELARRIRGLLADRTRLAALGIGGVDRVRSRYSWERIANETLKVYESVCETPEPTPTGDEDELELAVAG